MLRKLVIGRFVMTPDATGESNYAEIAATGTLAKFLSGVGVPKGMASHADLSWNRVIEWLRNMAALRENPVFTGDSADSGRSTSPSNTGISTPMPAWNR